MIADQDTPRTHALFRCVGCGAMGIERDCLGACDFRKFDVVTAQLYADLWAALDASEAWLAATRPLLARLAGLADGEALRAAYGDAQAQARALLRDARVVAPPDEARIEDERFTLWRCATCGQAEAAQECLGVCVRPVRDYVEEADFRALAERERMARERAQAARAVLRDVGWTRPRETQWGEAARRLRAQAGVAV
jgi:hypothetical protein